jgi:hypothetical protein
MGWRKNTQDAMSETLFAKKHKMHRVKSAVWLQIERALLGDTSTATLRGTAAVQVRCFTEGRAQL